MGFGIAELAIEVIANVRRFLVAQQRERYYHRVEIPAAMFNGRERQSEVR